MKGTNRLLWIILLCIEAGSPVFAQKFIFPGRKRKDKVAFDLVRNLIIVPLYLNGAGPYDFILDTGVGPMIITDSLLVETFDTGDMTTYTLQGAGEALQVQAFFSNRVSARIGKAYIKYIPTVFLKDDPLQISAYLGRPIHGILGSTFFHSFLVKVNYRNKSLRFYRFDARTRKKGRAIPIEIHFRKPYIHAQVMNDQGEVIPVLLLVDSGASHALSLEASGEQAFPRPEKTIPANLGIGLNGLISGHIGRVSTFKLDEFELSEVLASYPNFTDIGSKIDTPTRNGTLGSELLTRFKVTYNYRDSLMYLKPTRHFDRPFEHNMSGLEIFVEYGDPNRYFVSRIEPGSPADSSGFRHMDEILSVNLKAVEALSLDDIYDMLKAGPKRDVVFEIRRKEARLFKIITLKKRI